MFGEIFMYMIDIAFIGKSICLVKNLFASIHKGNSMNTIWGYLKPAYRALI